MRKKSVFWLVVLAVCAGQIGAQEQGGIPIIEAKITQSGEIQTSQTKGQRKQDEREDNTKETQSRREKQGGVDNPQGGETAMLNPASSDSKGLDPIRAKSGIYLQGSMGATFNRAIFDGNSALGMSKYNAIAINTMIGVGFGYQVFFTPHHGLRVFSTSLYGDFKTEHYKQNRPFNVITTGVGADYLWDFSDSAGAFGFFAGMGYQWNYGEFFRDLKETSFVCGDSVFRTYGFFAHIGFSKIFDWRHRIELAYRMPLYHFFDFAGKGMDRNGVPYDIARAQYFSAGVLNFNYIYVFGGKDAR